MPNNKINVFWFKRDLRVLDNLPLLKPQKKILNYY